MRHPRLTSFPLSGRRLPALPFDPLLLLPFLALGAALGFAAFSLLFIIAAVTYV